MWKGSLLMLISKSTAASVTISHTESKSTAHKVVPGCHEHVEPHRQTALFWHSIWLQCDRPRLGHVANIRRRSRAIYHRAIRDTKRQREQIIADKMGHAFTTKDTKSFWNGVKKLSCKGQSLPSTVDCATGSSPISDLFANKFNDIYTSVSYDNNDMSRVMEDIDVKVTDCCSKDKCHFNHCIDHTMISEAIKHLKKGKVDGDMCLYTDHLIHGTHRLNVLLALAINTMFTHGYCPVNLLSSTIIPIPKNKRNSLNDSNNYRGIALSSIIGKVIDIIVRDTEHDAFKTSDLQFGFKKKSSTGMCTFVLEEIVNYYVKNKSTVYSVFLDASKAFDRVHYVKLFQLLLTKGVCPIIARFLAFVYTKQECCIKWADAKSDKFFVHNGVKQGGVLSPFLFNIYLDVLLHSLEAEGFGCHIGNTYTGALAYADDIVLLSPTITSLKQQLLICEKFSADFDILFNTSKSKMLCFGAKENITLSFQGKLVPQVDTIKHLGNLVGSNSHSTNKNQVKLAINELYAKVNVLNKQFKYACEDIKYNLFKSHCLSLYGCQLWNLSSSVINNVAIAWRKCVRYTYNIHQQTHCNLLPYICQDIPILTQLHSRFLRFFISLWHSHNAVISTCAKLCMFGSCSRVSDSLNFICSKYNLNKYVPETLTNIKLHKADCDGPLVQRASAIRDFIHFRSLPHMLHDKANLNCIIDLLCTE
jgi:hypothetical protein